jgi:hypothetical protein
LSISFVMAVGHQRDHSHAETIATPVGPVMSTVRSIWASARGRVRRDWRSEN